MTTAALAPRYHGRHSRPRRSLSVAFPRVAVPSVGSAGPYAAAGVLAGGIAIGTAFTVAAAASASTGGAVGALAATMLPSPALSAPAASGLLGSGVGSAAVLPSADLMAQTRAVVAPTDARNAVSTDGVLGFSARAAAAATTVGAVTITPAAGPVSRTATRSSLRVNTGGLSAHAVAVIAAVRANFPQIGSIGTLRGGGGDHGSGHACDIMTSDVALGTAIAEYMRAHAGQLGITYVIWRQHIWSVARSGEGWRLMADRGSTTANHYDHVHVSVS